jgi:hypothetical protein
MGLKIIYCINNLQVLCGSVMQPNNKICLRFLVAFINY